MRVETGDHPLFQRVYSRHTREATDSGEPEETAVWWTKPQHYPNTHNHKSTQEGYPVLLPQHLIHGQMYAIFDCSFSLTAPLKVEGGYAFTLVCLSVSRISQKVMDGFRRNLVDRLGVCKDKLIRFWLRFGSGYKNILSDSSPLRHRAKTYMKHDISKVVFTDLDKTWWMSWIGDKNETIPF